MRRRNLALCYCTLLFIVSSSEPLKHEPRGNLMQDVIEDRSNLTFELLGKFYKDDNKTNVVPYEMCENSTCIPLCCPLGVRMIKDQCVAENVGRYPFPGVYKQATNESLERGPIGKVDQIFQLTVHDPCQKVGYYLLKPDEEPDDAFMFLLNGSLYLPHIKDFVDANLYCLIVSQRDKYETAVCINSLKSALQEIYNVGEIISMLFLLATFVVYSTLPELQNMHGYTLRGYVGSLFIAEAFNTILTPDTPIWETASGASCKIMAFYIVWFWVMASFFWLNVMCFDIWWAFRDFRSLQGSVKQEMREARERKKFVMYSIYAWGSASILTVIGVIMDFVPKLIQPEFGKTKCFFDPNKATTATVIYFIGLISVTVICNICLLISTARKIKDTTAYLRSSECGCHDYKQWFDNKQWFNLCRKLFILIGIWCFMEIIWPAYAWYLSNLTSVLEGLIIFITFVLNEKVKRLLLKRFSCRICC